MEFELKRRHLSFVREREYKIQYKEIILAHKFYADFVLEDKMMLELKAAVGGLADDQVAQTINYLKASGCKIGLLVNFGRGNLEFKRLIFW